MQSVGALASRTLFASEQLLQAVQAGRIPLAKRGKRVLDLNQTVSGIQQSLLTGFGLGLIWCFNRTVDLINAGVHATLLLVSGQCDPFPGEIDKPDIVGFDPVTGDNGNSTANWLTRTQDRGSGAPRTGAAGRYLDTGDTILALERIPECRDCSGLGRQHYRARRPETL